MRPLFSVKNNQADDKESMNAKDYQRLVLLKEKMQKREKVSEQDYRDFERLLLLYFQHAVDEQWRII